MKNYLTLVLILFFNVQIFSFENAEVLGDYVLYGNWELYSADSKSKDFFCCTTLNHEGGFKFRIIDFGRKEKDGQWYRILLNIDQYIYEGKSGVIKACTKFWIFIPDDSEVFRYY